MLDNPNAPDIGAHQIGVRQTGPRHEAFDLREWVSFAWRHWKFIAAVTALVLVVGTAYLLNQTRLYTATSQVLLDPQKEKMPGGDTMLGESRLNLAVIDSQIAIIRSTVFLRRVVERAHLVPAASAAAGSAPVPDEEGLFGAARGFALGLIGSWRGDEHAAKPAEPAAPGLGGEAMPAAELRAIEDLRESFQVARAPQRGYMLTIAVTSPDPAE